MNAQQDTPDTQPRWQWRQLGVVGVDTGCLMIVDPFNVVGPSSDLQTAKPGGWPQFCKDHFGDGEASPQHQPQIRYSPGHDGLGVVATTAHGDGVFPVYGLFDRHRSGRPHAMIVLTGEAPLPEVLSATEDRQ